ncbi:hypothetical protein GCM10009422_16010 [Brevundimonas kwangchunensis]|uniref:Flagellar hook-length control protein-like C-terminal domain-containing protein n=1 Tax=Brevundimonas kwangchunensis TaxID=322163 RepID=A0ABN1GVY1_9CAUL
MSAQAILSMIAPAIPAAPQGTANGDAVAFEGLLAAMLGAEGETDTAPAEPRAANDGPDAAEAGMIAPAVVAPPRPPAQPLVIAPPTPEAAATADTPSEDASPPAAATPSAPKLPLPPANDTADAADTKAADAAEASKVAASFVPVPVRTIDDPRAVPVEAAPEPVTPEEAALVATALGAHDEDAAEMASGETPERQPDTAQAARRQAEVAQPPVQTSPQPAPLRPLVDRASRPLDAVTLSDDGATPEARTAKTGVADAAPPTATPATDSAAGKTDAVPAVTAVPDSPDKGSGDAPVDAQSTETAAQTPAANVQREAASPTMSRTAIEATAQIAAQIQRRLEGRNTRFEIALTPDELGRVDVRLDIDAEGRLAARLAFDNPAAAADLRGRVDELRRQLEQFGFQVADDAFEFTERDSGSSAFDRGQDAREGQSRAFARATRLNLDAEAVALTPRWTNLSLTPTGVDLKV